MNKLIINADDFGLTEGCNKGIIKCMTEGVVTSSTLMINMPKAKHAVYMAKENGITSLGIHLNLTCGKPVLPKDEVQSLVDEDGYFYNRIAKSIKNINLKEAKNELEAQVNKFLDTGLKISHLDGHHHIQMYDGIKDIVIELCKKYEVPMRHCNKIHRKYCIDKNVKTTDYFDMNFYGDNVTVDSLKDIINGYEDGTIEIMTHPSYIDEELKEISSYSINREKELEVLTNTEFIKWLEDRGIELISFNDI